MTRPPTRRCTGGRRAACLALAASLAVSLGACSAGAGTATAGSPAVASSGLAPSSTETETPTRANGAIPSLTLPTDAGTGAVLPTSPAAGIGSASQVSLAVAELLDRRAQALASGDRRGWSSSVADPASAYGVRQAHVYDVMSALPVSAWRVESVESVRPLPTAAAPTSPASSPAAGSAGSESSGGSESSEASAVSEGPEASAAGGDQNAVEWTATVHQSYLLSGYDTAPREYQSVLTVRRSPTGWVLADDGLGPATRTSGSQAQPWDLPGAEVVRSGTALVVGNASRATLAGYLRLAQSAAPQVTAVWGSSAPAVLVAPVTLAELADQLHRTGSDPTAGLRPIAAVTDGPVARGTPASSDRIYLNPEAFARLTGPGRQAVVTHELTHVAVRASTTDPVPMWLSEGFADYVGFAHLDLPDTVVAADLVARVRQGKGPTALPSDASFDAATTSSADLGVAYNAAWLAVKRLVARYGPAKTVELYRTVATRPSSRDPATGLRAALPSVLATTQDAFVQDWLATLRQLAS